ncbi:SCP domain-containing protein [Plasmodiophora brassicae]|uniref:SCP domain-containing protein n=1 Tax=Plasmodiophora brassicae TaxID=37360 RepID=A0A0G4J4T1_PLABS|nr:hypothetical protein PBRA_009111 [Plasmodiophora brassicae]SPR01604.1 unnamed protein product [Plasmodiophora brassicae]
MSHTAVVLLSVIIAGVARADIAPADVTTLLSAHNAARASPLPQLTWDDHLASIATQWVNTCPSGHSADSLRQGASENIGWGWPTMNASEVASEWIKEKDNLVNGVCNAGAVCGHYQTIVDPKTLSVGCATKQNCPSQGQPVTQIWVCEYGATSGNSSTPTNSTSPPPTSNSSSATAPSAAATTLASMRRSIPITSGAPTGYMQQSSSCT